MIRSFMIIRVLIMGALIVMIIESVNKSVNTLKRLDQDVGRQPAGSGGIYHSNAFSRNPVAASNESVETLLQSLPAARLYDGQSEVVQFEMFQRSVDTIHSRGLHRANWK